jgi:ribosomal protein L11 methyltransferase
MRGPAVARAAPRVARGRAWVEVSVAVAATAAEAVAAVLHDLRAGGLVEERPTPGTARFRCYLLPSPLLPVTLQSLRARIRGLTRYGLDPGRVRITRRRITAQRWATAWRTHVRPVRVGRILIRPSWVRAVPATRRLVTVRIDPGMAFGTGMHPSTRLCLRAMQAHLPAANREGTRRLAVRGAVRPAAGRAVLDIGTGSGILAVAAALLGARVWAVDEDPVAVAVARGNVRLNGVAARVRVVRGRGLDHAPGRAHLILANLIAETIVLLLPRVRAHLAPGGVFIGSGIVADRLSAVLRAARAAGFRRCALLSDGEWRAVVLRSPLAKPTKGGTIKMEADH